MDTNHSERHDGEVRTRRPRAMPWKTVGLSLVIGLVGLAVVVWLGRQATDELTTMERWVADHGVWGRVVFVGMMIVLTSVFVPDIVFAIAAGVLFGLGWGTVLIVTGAIVTAALNYLAARTLLRPRIETMLEHYPKLRAIRRAAHHEGLRLQLLLRLTPLNPVTVSYVLGAAGVPFSTFMIATLGLIPPLFVEVYFGDMAGHVTRAARDAQEQSTLHSVVTAAGFVLCVMLMFVFARIARKALADADSVDAA